MVDESAKSRRVAATGGFQRSDGGGVSVAENSTNAPLERKTEVVGFSNGVMRLRLVELIIMETLTIPSSQIINVRVVRDCAVFLLQKQGKTLASSLRALVVFSNGAMMT